MFKENFFIFQENPKPNNEVQNTSSITSLFNETVENALRLSDKLIKATEGVGKEVKSGSSDSITTAMNNALSELNKISDPNQKEKFLKDLSDQIALAGAQYNKFTGSIEDIGKELVKLYEESDINHIMKNAQPCIEQGQSFIVINGYNPNEKPLVFCVPS